MHASNWKVVDGQSRVIGRFDLHLDSGLILRGATLVSGREGEFVSLPQRSWKKTDGKMVYETIIEFDSKERSQKFGAQALKAVQQLRGQNGAPD